uniref:B box-type domain-containing protein n=1 Tax=Syphacia muris TaxID=451379 RepID=A0A0N5AVF9_9BILA
MEEELKCPHCQQITTEPILLDCGHSYCRQCAISAQQGSCEQNPATSHSAIAPSLLAHTHSSTPLSPPSSSSAASDTISLCVSEQDPESDKLSIVSETDSGVVVCGRNSRPASLIGALPYSSSSSHYHRLPSILTPSTSSCSICCKNCHKTVYSLSDIKQVCFQLCDSDKPAEATVFCEQCDIYYCSSCQSALHPPRGPLATHKLIHPSARKRSRCTYGSLKDSKCRNHPTETLSMYCNICRTAVCCVCLQEIRHINHDVQSLEKTCKAQKEF